MITKAVGRMSPRSFGFLCANVHDSNGYAGLVKVLLATAFALALASALGCDFFRDGETTPVKQYRLVHGPDGHDAYVLWCDNGVSYCYELAGWLCPSGYDLLDKAGRVTGSESRGGAFAFGNSNTATAVSRSNTVTRTRTDMFLQCKYRRPAPTATAALTPAAPSSSSPPPAIPSDEASTPPLVRESPF